MEEASSLKAGSPLNTLAEKTGSDIDEHDTTELENLMDRGIEPMATHSYSVGGKELLFVTGHAFWI